MPKKRRVKWPAGVKTGEWVGRGWNNISLGRAILGKFPGQKVKPIYRGAEDSKTPVAILVDGKRITLKTAKRAKKMARKKRRSRAQIAATKKLVAYNRRRFGKRKKRRPASTSAPKKRRTKKRKPYTKARKRAAAKRRTNQYGRMSAHAGGWRAAGAIPMVSDAGVLSPGRAAENARAKMAVKAAARQMGRILSPSEVAAVIKSAIGHRPTAAQALEITSAQGYLGEIIPHKKHEQFSLEIQDSPSAALRMSAAQMKGLVKARQKEEADQMWWANKNPRVYSRGVKRGYSIRSRRRAKENPIHIPRTERGRIGKDGWWIADLFKDGKKITLIDYAASRPQAEHGAVKMMMNEKAERLELSGPYRKQPNVGTRRK